ncbi:MAG: FAD/NAD(P)-binding oxidoreductase [Thermoleophilia bacterium]|nr:NAD(P)/FAD-dependent oxidoreductase [Gaiellaceae bacterium]MDW8338244.1 FAD/NAD(P)-binding oxidoreductase [Thermoleophilia bacterium]
MSSRIVILGGGTGGTMVANRLRRILPPGEATITVVDRDDRHVYQPGLLFLPFGLARAEDLVRSRRRQLRAGIDFRESEVERVLLEENVVELADGTRLPYDVLVVATGAQLQPEETEGLTGEGWRTRMFTFYDVPGAEELARALERFDAGRLVVNVVDLPIKCPVAPLEFAFLADAYFTERGLRGDVEIVYVTPLDAAFTTPLAAERLSGLLEEKGIELVTEFAVGEVDGRTGRIVSWDEREVPFDLLVTVPLHAGASYVARSDGLGDDLGFVSVDPHTLQCRIRPNVFALGDAAGVPISKAGSVTHFEGEVLTENICRFLAGEPLDASYDGHASCFIETGFGKALLIDFNYETEPVPGRFPGAVGPLPLLRESRLNHLGKLMFQWLYWHALLPGRDIPGVSSAMTRRGKIIERASDRGGRRS